MNQRLIDIADSLARGEALDGALLELANWPARNIGAARMRNHIKDAMRELRAASIELHRIALQEAQKPELTRLQRLRLWAFGGESV